MRWLTLDLVVVSAFALIGRASHDEGLTAIGWWHTAWPFLTGAAVGWLALALLGRPPASLTSGLIVWMGTLMGGMLLRRVTGEGTAVPFVIVASVVLGVLFLGPRLAVRRGSRREPANGPRPLGHLDI